MPGPSVLLDAEKVKSARKTRGFLQPDAAKGAGVSPRTWSAAESGRERVRIQSAEKIAAFLKRGVADLSADMPAEDQEAGTVLGEREEQYGADPGGVAQANDTTSLRAKLEQAHEIIGRLTIRAETAEAALRAKADRPEPGP